MAYSGDICVKTGSYTDAQGQSKNRYEKIGAWFTDDQGRISINISMIPLMPPDPNGKPGFYASLFHKQGQGQQQQPAPRPAPQQGARQRQPATGRQAPAPSAYDDDQVPY